MNQPVHFTYDTFEEQDGLFQGDILQPTGEIRSIFKEVHPHFLDEKYNAFLVLTQTCDLVRRGNNICRSRYINLAVIRTLEDVLSSLLDRVREQVKLGESVLKGLYVKESNFKAKQLLERIFNQNEQAMGIFYLHPDASVRIAVPSVALLQVSVAIRARENYEVLIKSRTGRLKPEFRSKLGWLIGNLFSRVATEDMSTAVREELIGHFLGLDRGADEFSNGVRWISRDCVREAQKKKVTIGEKLTVNEIADSLEKHKPSPPIETAINQILLVVGELVEGISPDELERIKRRLKNDLLFQSAIK